MSLPEWLLNSMHLLDNYRDILVLLIQIFVIIFLTMIARFLQSKLFRKMLVKLSDSHRIWDEAALFSLQKPLGALIWLVGITAALQVISAYYDNTLIATWVGSIRLVGAILVFTWFLLRFISRIEQHYSDLPGDRVLDDTSIQVVGRLLRVSVFLTALLVILPTLGISISGVLAIGGAGGFAIGFAAKDLFANFFGGLMVYLDKPFKVGDWIRSPDREIEGTVEHIGWRTTRIRCFDKRPLYVPNGVFSVISVQNPSRMTHRRIRDILGLRYQDATVLPKIVEDIETMLREHNGIDDKQTTFVRLYHFGDSSLDCEIYCFTKTKQWVPYLKVQQDVLLKMLQIVESYGAEVAFPTRTIEVSEAEKLPV